MSTLWTNVTFADGKGNPVRICLKEARAQICESADRQNPKAHPSSGRGDGGRLPPGLYAEWVLAFSKSGSLGAA